ncbi:response regulator [Pantanalinema sp. GBBB05]|uniref:hybrid sensor histidine kinase/response regulator n=1 Tax=Pantanalinema sp. GBBB05 TaxID=2604139 RepID=UPI001DA27BE8|nr:response regulator [Pantanalinema sp. GBBB05]
MADAPSVKILHVDDNDTNRYVVQRMLQNVGFEVLGAATGAAGLQLVTEHIPDLVILDVKLPDTNGFEVCRQIKANPATTPIPVLMLSASLIESQDKAHGLDSGADAYLAQPVAAIELLATIRSLLRIRQAEDAALALARQWQTTFDSISDGMGLLDQEGCFLRCNQALLKLFNQSMNAILGESHQQVMVAHLGTNDTPFPKVQETLRRESLEIQARGHWYTVIIEPVLNQQERLAGAVYILNDITDRRRAEENRLLLSAIVESSQDAIIGFTLYGTIVSWNTGAEKIFGYTAAEIKGQSISFLASPDRPGEALQILDTIRRGESITNLETVCFRQDGQPIEVSITVSPIKSSDERLVGISATVRDITERKQAEAEREQLLALEQTAREQAEAANRIKDEFLAVLSHELRSPLNPILGWAKLLQSRHFDEAALKKALETIERNASLQAQLIEDLLDVSRIMRGKLSLNMVPVDLAATITAALETVRLAAEAKSIQIDTNLDSAIGRVLGDAARLQQIVWNLLSNAVKFTPEGRRVDVYLERIDSHARLIVSDTGKGINPDFLPHVFDYFRQADSTTTRKFGGLGLGLAIVRYLVELHGGTVWAESLGEDQGATFTVSFPLIEDTPKPQAELIPPTTPPTTPVSPLTNLQILVVDDDSDSRNFFAYALEQYGAIVTAVDSAQAALQLVTQSEFDLLLSDIGMPEMDGYTLLRQIRALEVAPKKSILAIALTAYAGEINQQQALAAGFQRHIAKPVTLEELIQEIISLVSPV